MHTYLYKYMYISKLYKLIAYVSYITFEGVGLVDLVDGKPKGWKNNQRSINGSNVDCSHSS